MGNFKHNAFFFFLYSLPMQLSAQQTEPIGQVLLTRGSVQAIDTNGSTHSLSRRSDVSSRDTIITGPQGFVQMRFVDNAMIALGKDTEFRINEYRFDGDPATPDTVLLELVRGGIRTISGAIGESSNDEYRLDSPFASVTSQSATYECIINLDKIHCGVYNSTITITNAEGSLVMGLGGNYDYVEAGIGQPPAGLLSAPAGLGQISMNPVASQQGSAANSPPVDFPAQGTRRATTPVGNPNFPEPEPITVTPYRKE